MTVRTRSALTAPRRALLSLAIAGLGAVPLRGQKPDRWNDRRVLDLVRRAQALRRSVAVDSALRSYEADAHGYVYFFFDRPGSDRRTLAKADQIAVDVSWQAPDRTHQTIVGRRDEKVLPTDIRYHIDHLTVVQGDFGNVIRVGNGEEVADVLHPLAPRAENVYDYRLSDSLSLRYGQGSREVRVYEVQVRPRDPDRPGFVGSVYLDRDRAAIVRMDFTFTPASYVDPYLDQIRISLDNALWMGRYWLPYRQELEVRREMRLLDFRIGSVIRARFEISHYRFNVALPPGMMMGPRISILPPRELAAFPFKRGLFADLNRQGLAPTPSIARIRGEAEQIMRQRYLGGLSRTRIYVPSFSDAVRYDRAEGLFLGAGVKVHPLRQVVLTTQAGYGFRRQEASWSVSATRGTPPVVPTLEVYWDALRDLGPLPASSGAVNTLSALVFSRDHLDPYFVRGARLMLSGVDSTKGLRLDVRWERERSARDVEPEGPGGRPVLPVDEGILRAADGALGLSLPWGGAATLQGTLGRLEKRTFGTLLLATRWTMSREGERGWHGEADALAGVASSRAPVQSLWFLGGRGTLPGYPFREWAGDRFWLVRAEGTLPLLRPWVGLRVFAALGQTLLDARTFPPGWRAHDSAGPRSSVGVGLSLGWDVVRLDLGRGLQGGGDWELTFSVSPRFRPWL